MEMRLFFRKLTILTLLVAFVSAILFYFIPSEYVSPAYPYLLAFFYFSSLGIYAILAKSVKKRPAVFSTNFMFITVLKLFLLMVFLGFYIYLNRDDAIPFVIGFFILYIGYTVFETIEIMKLLKTIKPPEKDS